MGFHDMIVLAPLCEEPEIGLLAGASDLPRMCGGHILRSTCGGCGMRRGVPVSVWLPKVRQYLLWVALADLCGGLPR